jgi:hypothetical protein
MKKHSFSRLITISVGIGALTALMMFTSVSSKAPALAAPAPADNASEDISFLPLVVFGTSNVVPTSGTELIRGKDAVFMSLTTKNLTPGWVYTAWLGIFNNPEECATHPCSGMDFTNSAVQGSRVNCGGRIIGPDGSATFGSFVGIADTTSAFDGPGLLDPKHAEIHFVVRSHGLASMDATILGQQLSKFNGGCPMGVGCANVQAAIHQPPSDK